jgi:TPR repeat protein
MRAFAFPCEINVMEFLNLLNGIFRPAAEAAAPDYQRYLLVKDYAGALPHLLAAIKQDDAAAMSQFATMLLTGHGVPQDLAESALWYRQAAVRDHPTGMAGLGMLCSLGQGVAQDLGEAAFWLYKATLKGHQRAANALLHLLTENPTLYGLHFTEDAFCEAYAAAFGDNESFLVNWDPAGSAAN